MSTAAIQELVNGARNLVLKVDISMDGSTHLDDEPLVEVGAFDCPEVRLDSIKGTVSGMQIELTWDGATQAPLYVVPDDDNVDVDFRRYGGLTNPKVANWTGDVMMNTLVNGAIPTAGDTASLVFHFVKKGT